MELSFRDRSHQALLSITDGVVSRRPGTSVTPFGAGLPGRIAASPVRSRARFTIAILLAAALGSWLAYTSLGGSLETYVSPATLKAAGNTTYRLNGLVAPGAPSDAADLAQTAEGLRFVVRDKQVAGAADARPAIAATCPTVQGGARHRGHGQLEGRGVPGRPRPMIAQCPSKFPTAGRPPRPRRRPDGVSLLGRATVLLALAAAAYVIVMALASRRHGRRAWQHSAERAGLRGLRAHQPGRGHHVGGAPHRLVRPALRRRVHQQHPRVALEDLGAVGQPGRVAAPVVLAPDASSPPWWCASTASGTASSCPWWWPCSWASPCSSLVC